MIEKQDETRIELKEEIRSGTSEISSKLDRTNDLLGERFTRVERDLDEIKRFSSRLG
jgi:hypothetical protein